MSLFYLQLPASTSDQPLDLMDDTDTYVLDLPSEQDIAESLDDAIMAKYREIWS